MYPLSRPHAPQPRVQGHFYNITTPTSGSFFSTYSLLQQAALKNIITQLFRVQNRKLTFFYYSAKIENMNDEFTEQLLHEVNSEGWHSLVKYALDLPEGTETHGYRVFYKASNGKLYSAYHVTPEYTESHLDELTPFEEGELYHDKTERGYYYWANKQMAEAYLNVTQIKHPLIGRGEYVLREVFGIATSKGRDEGDRMNDMIILKNDLEKSTSPR